MIVTQGQSLIDIALQEYGTMEALLGFAKANGLSVDQDLAAGQVLITPAELVTNKAIADYIKARGIKIATGINNYIAPEEPEPTEGLIDWADEDFAYEDWL